MRVSPVGLLGVMTLAGVVSYVVFHLRSTTRGARSMARASICTLAEIAAGEKGRVLGVARQVEASLISPLTSRPCVYYEAAVFDFVYVNGQQVWRRRGVTKDGRDFIVEDKSGSARVSIQGAVLAIEADQVELEFQHFTEPQHALLAKLNVKPQQTMRFDEAIIEVGGPVSVMGTLLPGSAVGSGHYAPNSNTVVSTQLALTDPDADVVY